MNNTTYFPLISIRIPLYNHEKYILKTLGSILEDTYPNKEIVIIDDGSRDHSAELVLKWINEHPDVSVKFISRENRGITNTLNELNSMCEGEYIVGLASDDFLLNDSITTRYKWLKSNMSKKVVFTDCCVVNEKDDLLFQSALKEYHKANIDNLNDEKALSKELITKWCISGGTLMLHRSIYEEYRYKENDVIEDYDFFLFCASKKYLGFIDTVSSAYRLHETNTSRDRSKYLHRQMNMIKTLGVYFFVFSKNEKILILKKIFWLLRKVIKNRARFYK